MICRCFLGRGAIHTDILLPHGLLVVGTTSGQISENCELLYKLVLIAKQTSHCFHKILSLDYN